MLPVFSMVLIIGLVISLSLAIIILYNFRRQKQLERLEASFADAVAELNLSIVKKQELGKRMIGYDDVNRKLLFISLEGDQEERLLIDLEKIRTYSVHKVYGPVGSYKTVLSIYVDMVALQLNPHGNGKPILLPFYTKTSDSATELRERSKQANDWKVMLTEGLTKEHYVADIRNKTTETRQLSFIKIAA